MNDNMEKETFESILKEKLGNHELPVNPSLWKSVSTQAGLSSGSAGLGIGSWIGIASIAVAITVGVVYVASLNETPTSANADKTTQEQTHNARVNANFSKEVRNEESSSEKAKTGTTESLIPGKDSYNGITKDTEDQLFNTKEDPFPEAAKNESLDAIVSGIQEPVITPIANATLTNNIINATVLNAGSSTDEPSASRLIVMPNAITPNGDGVNDVLTLNTEGLTDFSLVVLDVTNKVVFSSTDPNFLWNGLFQNGDPAPAGIYQYYFTAKDEKGAWCNRFSSLTILR